MPLYTKESLEQLRSRIDLSEVLSAHLQLERSGSSYKALCPFHEEKTPSFVLQRGDTHYHCYGCGAHGDAIAFLMSHLKMGFVDAIEHLAERFHVPLERIEKEETGPSKSHLKQVVEKACQFYHFALLQTQEGEAALKYLEQRGIDAAFIQAFRIGFAPRGGDALGRFLRGAGFKEELLEQTGLLNVRGKDFFSDRITFPICDALGAVIGFSARKFKEETFGGKYVNTQETTLFKKSQVLFGLHYSRQRIAKEQKAVIVEGQIDALRLIHAGFNFTVAAQGTAFGEGHVKQLVQLGVRQVYLALDPDIAGSEAAVKIGNLFQKKAVAVSVLSLPAGKDPDALVREEGAEAFQVLMDKSVDYLTFLISHFSKKFNLSSPSDKNELVQVLSKQIRGWEHPVMVHESLRKLAQLLGVPESVIGLSGTYFPNFPIKKTMRASLLDINPDQILETDLLRWLFLVGERAPQFVELIEKNVQPRHFSIPHCAHLFSLYLNAFKQKLPRDLLTLAASLENVEEQELLSEIMQKKINLQKAKDGVEETIHKILQRDWMAERENIRAQMQSGHCTEEQALILAKQFDTLKKSPPEVKK